MNTPTIPEIAEMLRTHVRNSNEAPRLILEHVLPLIGIEVDTLQELKDALDSSDLMSDVGEELTTLRKDLQRQIDGVCERIAETEKELNDLSDTQAPALSETLQFAANDLGCRVDDLNEMRGIADDLKDLAARLTP